MNSVVPFGQKKQPRASWLEPCSTLGPSYRPSTLFTDCESGKEEPAAREGPPHPAPGGPGRGPTEGAQGNQPVKGNGASRKGQVVGLAGGGACPTLYCAIDDGVPLQEEALLNAFWAKKGRSHSSASAGRAWGPLAWTLECSEKVEAVVAEPVVELASHASEERDGGVEGGGEA